MKKDKDLFSVEETARKLGLSRDLLLRELEDGKITACWRGKRRKFTQRDIDGYIKRQVINNSAVKMPYNYKHIKEVKLK